MYMHYAIFCSILINTKLIGMSFGTSKYTFISLLGKLFFDARVLKA